MDRIGELQSGPPFEYRFAETGMAFNRGTHEGLKNGMELTFGTGPGAQQR
jgi:hypothetical protein